ncbi:hypothetical protein [Streptomyces sp. NBC_00035]|uniref:hypothetical protein n=1 Tax=Streptomyces sp. NBC_00035 TaxID=2903614 RepID=UPI00324CBBCD
MPQHVPPGHLDAEQTATLLGITRGNLRILVHRGHLTASGGTDRHPHYRLEDVKALHRERAARSGHADKPERPSASSLDAQVSTV